MYLGKLFNSILRERLVTFIDKHNIMHKNQGSNCKGARTSDHLLVLRFLIDKYVKQGKHKLYACFFDLRKAFDTVNQAKLFYNLLTEYKVGGHFLGILKSIYTSNQIFFKTSG